MQEKFVRTEQANLWTSRQGQFSNSSLPVILSSGGPGCCDYLEPVAAMLERSTEVYRWEQAGCGRSEEQPPYEVANCLTDLEAIRPSYRISRWVVGGHSWGANLSLLYALAYPQHVAGVIHLSGTSFLEDWKAAYREGLANRGEREPAYAYPPNREVNSQLNASYKLYLKNQGVASRETSRLATLHIPVLIVQGSADIRPTWQAQQLAQSLLVAQFELIEDAEHVLWLTHHHKLSQLMQNFLHNLPTKT